MSGQDILNDDTATDVDKNAVLDSELAMKGLAK
jgi:hypothetical protein